MPRTADPQRATDILASARVVFLRDGYGDAHMTDIAADAGVAVGTLYRYFDSKETLSHALAEQFFRQLTAAALPALAAIEDAADVDAFVHHMLGLARAERDLLRLVHPAWDSHDPGCAKQPPDPAVLREPISRILAAKMAAGIVHRYDPDVLAELLISIMQRAIKHTVQDDEPTSGPYEDSVSVLLQRALIASEGAGSRQPAAG
jgi:AcrR family transcriptional regulator